MKTYISRQISVTNEKGETTIYSDHAFFLLNQPLIILGEPGAGKSASIEKFKLATSSSIFSPQAISIISIIEPLSEPAKVIIDGLDEMTVYNGHSATLEILKKLFSNGIKQFVLTCRAADWHDDINTNLIESLWGQKPVIGTLLPMNRSEIKEFIALYDKEIDAETFIAEAENHDAFELLGNPQNLTMLLKTTTLHGWPETKTELFEKACIELVKEENNNHNSLNRNRPHTDELIDAAGFICAQLLLSNHVGFNIDGQELNNYLKSSSLQSSRIGSTLIITSLSTKVFKSTGSNTVEPCHRTVAEFLGAKWIAKELRSQLSLKRLQTLLYLDQKIVPTALRGLHAWIITLCPDKAFNFISNDPYGFLRYGDPAVLSNSECTRLLAFLRTLADNDPFFRNEDPYINSGKGFLRESIISDIITVLRDTSVSYQLKHLIINSIGGDIVNQLEETLTEIILDSSVSQAERRVSVEVLSKNNTKTDWPAIVRSLRLDNKFTSLREAIEILKLQTSLFDGKTIADIIIEENQVEGNDVIGFYGFEYTLYKQMDLCQIENAMERFYQALSTGLVVQRESTLQRYFLMLVSEYIVRGAVIDPEKLWQWINKVDYYKNETSLGEFYKKLLSNNDKLRESFEMAAIDSCLTVIEMWSMLFRLDHHGQHNLLHIQDIKFLLLGIVKNERHYQDWPQRWEKLLYWVQIKNRAFEFEIIEFARQQSKDHKELIDILHAIENPPQSSTAWEEEYKIKRTEQEKEKIKQNIERQNSYYNVREGIKNGICLEALYNIANTYLNRTSDFERIESILGKVEELVGTGVYNYAIEGIRNIDKTQNFPKPREIIVEHINGRYFYLEDIAICHCKLLQDNGVSLNNVSIDILQSALAAFQWSSREAELELYNDIKNIVFSDTVRKKQFLRDTIEPYFDVNNGWTNGLYHFGNDNGYEDIAEDLCLDWLNRYSNLANENLKYLLTASTHYCSYKSLEKFATQGIDNLNPERNDENMLWVAFAFLVSPEVYLDKLVEFVQTNIQTIFSIKDLLYTNHRRNSKKHILTVFQNLFVVKYFGPIWGPSRRRSGTISGDKNAWDASEFINECLRTLSRTLTEEATNALENLVADAGLTLYHDFIKHCLSSQIRDKAENGKKTATLNDVRSILLNYSPNNIDDLQAILLDELETLQQKLAGNQTDEVVTFWNNKAPHTENYCRDRIVNNIEPRLERMGIRLIKEAPMPQNSRCDFVAMFKSMNLPVEIKGQWHKDLYEAPTGQMTNYTNDHRAKSTGIYLILWFGDVEDKKRRIKGFSGKPLPTTAPELRNLVQSIIKPKLITNIETVVLDLSN